MGHTRSLAEHGYVVETASPNTTDTLYRRAKDSLALEQPWRILDETATDMLSAWILEGRNELPAYSDRFDPTPQGRRPSPWEIDVETLLEWRTTRRNLAFAEVALALSAVEDATGAAEAV